MRFRKYYDAIQTNSAFLKASLKQKWKILFNIFKYCLSFKKLIANHKPVTAQIEPTSFCNLNCEMCIREKIGVPIGNMSFENFKIILDKLDCLFKVHLSGQGEPFLNKDIFKIIDYASKRGVYVKMSTNGSLINEGVAKKLAKLNIGEITISVDSTKKETYEKIRKGAKFEKLVENLKNLNKKLEENKKKTIVSTATVVLKDNENELDDFVDFARKTGVKKIIFQTLQNKQDYLDKYDSKIRVSAVGDFSSRVKEKIKKVSEKAKPYGIGVIFDEQKSLGCVWPWRSIYITWNGNVTACCKILDYRKPAMGNMLKENFWKIWNGKNYQMFRKLLRDRKAPLPCEGCNMV